MQAQENYMQLWEDIFSSRSWGRYPPEDLVRFVARSFGKSPDRSQVKILEVGCGPGANLWYMHREGYSVAGIDYSPTAIEQATERLNLENKGINSSVPDLKVGDFSVLPWEDGSFDAVIDIYGICANKMAVIQKTTAEVHRVLKPGGRFYTKQWGKNCTGYGEGTEIEPGTYDDIPSGPCHGAGVNHFFDKAELEKVFGAFNVVAIDVLTRTESCHDYFSEEYLCHFMKPE